jgi:hypothetical protein
MSTVFKANCASRTTDEQAALWYLSPVVYDTDSFVQQTTNMYSTLLFIYRPIPY